MKNAPWYRLIRSRREKQKGLWWCILVHEGMWSLLLWSHGSFQTYLFSTSLHWFLSCLNPSDAWSAWQIKGLVHFPSQMLIFLSQLDHELLTGKDHLFSFLLSSKALNKCWFLVATGFSLADSWWSNNRSLYREIHCIQSIIGAIWSISGVRYRWIIVPFYRWNNWA